MDLDDRTTWRVMYFLYGHDRSLSQRDIADMLGLSVSAVSRHKSHGEDSGLLGRALVPPRSIGLETALQNAYDGLAEAVVVGLPFANPATVAATWDRIETSLLAEARERLGVELTSVDEVARKCLELRDRSLKRRVDNCLALKDTSFDEVARECLAIGAAQFVEVTLQRLLQKRQDKSDKKDDQPKQEESERPVVLGVAGSGTVADCVKHFTRTRIEGLSLVSLDSAVTSTQLHFSAAGIMGAIAALYQLSPKQASRALLERPDGGVQPDIALFGLGSPDPDSASTLSETYGALLPRIRADLRARQVKKIEAALQEASADIRYRLLDDAGHEVDYEVGMKRGRPKKRYLEKFALLRADEMVRLGKRQDKKMICIAGGRDKVAAIRSVLLSKWCPPCLVTDEFTALQLVQTPSIGTGLPSLGEVAEGDPIGTVCRELECLLRESSVVFSRIKEGKWERPPSSEMQDCIDALLPVLTEAAGRLTEKPGATPGETPLERRLRAAVAQLVRDYKKLTREMERHPKPRGEASREYKARKRKLDSLRDTLAHLRRELPET